MLIFFKSWGFKDIKYSILSNTFHQKFPTRIYTPTQSLNIWVWHSCSLSSYRFKMHCRLKWSLFQKEYDSNSTGYPGSPPCLVIIPAANHVKIHHDIMISKSIKIKLLQSFKISRCGRTELCYFCKNQICSGRESSNIGFGEKIYRLCFNLQ